MKETSPVPRSSRGQQRQAGVGEKAKRFNQRRRHSTHHTSMAACGAYRPSTSCHKILSTSRRNVKVQPGMRRRCQASRRGLRLCHSRFVVTGVVVFTRVSPKPRCSEVIAAGKRPRVRRREVVARRGLERGSQVKVGPPWRHSCGRWQKCSTARRVWQSKGRHARQRHAGTEGR